MTWLVIGDGRRQLTLPQEPQAGLVTSGSLVIEASFVAQKGCDQILLHLDRVAGWHRSFRMTFRADGELFVEHRQNREVTYAVLQAAIPHSDTALRITYSWDGPARQGLLSVENLDSGHLDQVKFEDPQPWPMDDIIALTDGGDSCSTDPNLTLIAVSDTIATVGIPPGLAAETLVETAAGPRRVGELKRGDLILTADRGFQPVRGILTQELPTIGRLAPIRLYAPFFGLERDLVVAPDQRIQIEGADAEYLFGADAVLVEARHLATVSAGRRALLSRTVEFVQVILDAHTCIHASGTWVESLYLGDPADHPIELGSSGLAAFPRRALPRHTQIASPLLKSYEAVVLVSALCA